MTGDEPEQERTFVAVAPADRPRLSRTAVRVLVVDGADRLLLFRDSDPGVPGAAWWITPGGGTEPGEGEHETAVREVHEETGFVITADDLVGPLARRHVVHGYSDQVVEQDEVFYLAHVEEAPVDTSAHTAEEQATITDHRWWTASELAEPAEEVWPADLLRIRRLADDPPAQPLDLGEVEESTVPAG